MSTSAVGDSRTLVVNGFENNIKNEINPEGPLEWFCAPDSWTKPDDETKREGMDGKWFLDKASSSLVIYPAAKKDFWRRTYYEPLLIKDDGAVLYATLSRSRHCTIETTFQLMAVCQFDQAGVCVRLDSQHWIKTGIEVVDQKARLSCVVTNVYSDWSTQAWPSVTTMVGEGNSAQQVDCSIRIHCRGSSFVVEAKFGDEWEFVRIAHLNDTIVATKDDPSSGEINSDNCPNAETFWGGIFSCCPEDQQGGHAIFTSFRVVEGSEFEHNAESNLE